MSVLRANREHAHLCASSHGLGSMDDYRQRGGWQMLAEAERGLIERALADCCAAEPGDVLDQ